MNIENKTKAMTSTPVKEGTMTPQVEIHIASHKRTSAAADGGGNSDSRLSEEQISLLQTTITNLIQGFRPPDTHENGKGLSLDSLEVEISFKVETGSGTVIKLLLDGKAEASITAKVVWSK